VQIEPQWIRILGAELALLQQTLGQTYDKPQIYSEEVDQLDREDADPEQNHADQLSAVCKPGATAGVQAEEPLLAELVQLNLIFL
jgi:hypothetical protein